MTEIAWQEIFLRLALSCALGSVVGYERESMQKSAGLRTNALVCLGACLVMILSQEMFLGAEGRTNADPARLAAQVVSGIGFLGAGAILKEGANVHGLTTAACLWVVAGIGLAVGAGCYLGAFFTTGFVFLTLDVLYRLDRRAAIYRPVDLLIEAEDLPEQLPRLTACLTKLGMIIHEFKADTLPGDGDAGVVRFTLLLYNPGGVHRDALYEQLRELPGVRKIEIH